MRNVIMRHKLLVGGAGLLVIVGIGFAACGGSGPGASGPGSGHSQAYNEVYDYGYQHLNPEGQNPANFFGAKNEDLCLASARSYAIDDRADYNKGCLDGVAARAKKGMPKQ
jgi:hypothetical protein